MSPDVCSRALSMHRVHSDARSLIAITSSWAITRKAGSPITCRALVLGQGVVERDLFACQAGLFTSGALLNVLGQLDQLFEHLRRRDRIGVIAGNGGLKALCEGFGLRHVALGLRSNVAIDQLL